MLKIQQEAQWSKNIYVSSFRYIEFSASVLEKNNEITKYREQQQLRREAFSLFIFAFTTKALMSLQV